jgi:Flp pilus assembly protein TadD
VNLYKMIDDALQLEEKGENDQALEVWKKAAALEPENAKVQNGLGISLYVHGDRDEGFEHLRHAIRISPFSAENHFILGRFLLDEGHAEEALPELEVAVQIKPHFASCEEALAIAHEDMGMSADALAHWRRAIEIEPGRTSAALGMSWLLATASDAAIRNGAEAVKLAEGARGPEPENAEALDTLAAAYAEDGQFVRATSTEAQALQLAAAQGNKSLPFREEKKTSGGKASTGAKMQPSR